jgi:hypothetical protein
VVGGPVAGVGQRMITGVAKRMATQFFTAVDAELTGAVGAIAAAPSAAAVSVTDVETPAAQPQVFTKRAGVPAGTSDLRTLAIGAVGGSLLTLLGVLVGYRLGRRLLCSRINNERTGQSAITACSCSPPDRLEQTAPSQQLPARRN